jgi:hypothetical protein
VVSEKIEGGVYAGERRATLTRLYGDSTAARTVVLSSACVSRWPATESGNSPPYRGRPCDALDHGHRFLCFARQRR